MMERNLRLRFLTRIFNDYFDAPRGARSRGSRARAVCVVAGASLIAGHNGNASAADFQGLGDLPGLTFASRATAVSADGRVVVGQADIGSDFDEAFRWEAGVMTGLGDLPGGDFFSEATAVSADGGVVVGSSKSSSGTEAFLWIKGPIEGVMIGLGDLPGGDFDSRATGVSADGTIIVGTGTPDDYFGEAFRWENGKMTGLGVLDHKIAVYSEANAISADGRVIVGIDDDGEGSSKSEVAFRWEGGQIRSLEDLSGKARSTVSVDAVSSDGSVIVGAGIGQDGIEALRWDWKARTVIGLGAAPGGVRSRAFSVSGDGAVIVGQSFRDFTDSSEKASVWDATGKMQELQDLLTDTLSLDLTGWDLKEATGISADAHVIVGNAINPAGDEEAFRAFLGGDLHWQGPTVGQWDDPTNWGPLGFLLPSKGDTVMLDTLFDTTVIGPEGQVEIDSLLIGQGGGRTTLQLNGSVIIPKDANSAAVFENGVLTGRGTLFGNLGNLGTITADDLVIVGVLQNAGVVNGSGRIDADFGNLSTGRVLVGPGQFIQFAGAFNVNSGRIELLGGVLTFDEELVNGTDEADGLIIGHGSIRSEVQIHNTVDGTMALSGQTDIVGQVLNEGLIVSSGGGPVTFFDDVTNFGEIRTSDNSFTVFFGDYSGSGSLTTGPLRTGTIVMEGGVNLSNSSGAVSIDGNLIFRTDARYDVEIGGVSPGVGHDQLDVAGQATLNGTLNVTLLNGFDPAVGDVFRILTTASTGGVHGAFSGFTGDIFSFLSDLALVPVVDADAGEVRLVATYPGDANLDLTVDAADLNELALNWQQDVTDWHHGDFNNDGFVDARDLNLLAINWQFGVPAGSLTSFDDAWADALASTVPEPTTLGLFVLGGIAIIKCRGNQQTHAL